MKVAMSDKVKPIGRPKNSFASCEADAEFWRKVRAKRANVQVTTIKRMPSPWATRNDPHSDKYWLLDGKQTDQTVFNSNYIWHTPGARPVLLYQKLKGTHALDICSSYGCSSRSFLGKHESVDVIEFEGWYAHIVRKNIKSWKLEDRIRVAVTRDLSQIDFTAYDSVRFGIKQIEYEFYNYIDSFLSINNLCFEFDTNIQIRKLLLDQGYRDIPGYVNCDVFTKHK